MKISSVIPCRKWSEFENLLYPVPFEIRLKDYLDIPVVA
jgi:hypothetical protein